MSSPYFQPEGRPGPPPPPPLQRRHPVPGLLVGVLAGALAGLAMAGVEAAVLGWSGLALPSEQLALHTLALYAITGAVLGAGPGLAGARGAGWVWATVCMAGAWLLSGRLASVVEAAGIPPVVGSVAALGLGVLPAVAVPRLLAQRRSLLFALTAGLAVLLALGLPVNLHLLGSPTSSTALAVDLVLLIPACVGAAAAALILGHRDSELAVGVSLVAVGALGWLAAWPVLRTPAPQWPVSTTSGQPLVLVVVDTLRADHLGVYGYNRPTSPHIDKRARLVYGNATASAPWTLPSMGTILTGLDIHHHGAGVHDGERNLRTGLADKATTVAELLQRQDYATAAVVTNPWVIRSFSFHRGFETYDDDVGPAALPSALHPLRAIRLDPLAWPAYRDAEALTDRAIDFVRAQQGGRWFLLVHYMDVHGPLSPEAEDREAVGAHSDTVLDAYDASIHEVDRQLERLLQALPRDAVVVLTSDHGEQLGEARVPRIPLPPGTRHGHTVHQELLHVPLILWGPGIPWRRVDRPVSQLHLAPTLLHLASVRELPPDLDGQVLPEILSQAPPREPEVILSMSVHFGPEQQAVRQGRHKLVVHADGSTELYDLQADPGEKNPDRSMDPEVRQLRRQLGALLPEIGVAGAEASVEREMGELLERLGYRE